MSHSGQQFTRSHSPQHVSMLLMFPIVFHSSLCYLRCHPRDLPGSRTHNNLFFFNYNEWPSQTRTYKKGLCSSEKALSIKVEHSSLQRGQPTFWTKQYVGQSLTKPFLFLMKHIHLHRDIQSRVLPQITPAAVILFMFYIIFSLHLIEKCSVPLFSKQRKIFLIVINITRVTPSQKDSSGAKSSISVVSISRFFKAQHQHWLLFSSYRDTQKYQPALNRRGAL